MIHDLIFISAFLAVVSSFVGIEHLMDHYLEPKTGIQRRRLWLGELSWVCFGMGMGSGFMIAYLISVNPTGQIPTDAYMLRAFLVPAVFLLAWFFVMGITPNTPSQSSQEPNSGTGQNSQSETDHNSTDTCLSGVTKEE